MSKNIKLSYKLFSDLLTEDWRPGDGGDLSSPGKPGVEVVAVEGGGGGEEEGDVEGEEGEDGEVEVEAQGSVLQETLCGSDSRSGDCGVLGGGEVQAQHCHSQQGTEAPPSHGVAGKLQAGSVGPPRQPGLLEGPEEVVTHDRHPAEHGDGGEVSQVAESPALGRRELVGEVVGPLGQLTLPFHCVGHIRRRR